MGIYALKFGFGILIFTAYRFTATRGGRWLTPAGGMLLTFPALNGLGLLATDASPTAAAAAMLPMIALNGFLAAGIIQMLLAAHERQASIAGRRALSAIFIALVMWLATAIALNQWAPSLPTIFQPWFIGAYAVVGLAILAMSRPVKIRKHLSKQPSFLRAERKTILLFAVLLLVLLGTAFAGAGDRTIAQLSALPLLPFFGLYATSQQTNASETLRALRTTILLGPALAMAFVALAAPHIEATSAISEMSGNAIVLLGGWVACFATIAVVSALQGWFQSRAHTV